VDHIKDELARPRRVEADIAVAVAIGPCRLWRSVETLAEVVSAAAHLDDAQPVNLVCQPILGGIAQGGSEFVRKGRPGSGQQWA
jgi:hypothetical protein